ncbi:glycoside hydrolase family 65 protein, partial [Flavobacteriaceae bacterium]|nr:glycoside hydrolase family 65 protein [Flavobacteriaceae bacterium]
PHRFAEIKSKLNWNESESSQWETIANQMYFPKHPDQDLFLQQDGFLDKDLIPAKELLMEERPINQHWSWDRILRSPYIKQADVLQGFYFFQDHFQQASLKRHFDFYEPLTVHESSLSSCVHSILAARLGEIELAYTFYLQTSRLDLDDYNKEVEEGLHITSMAGTWMSIVEGFGGVQVINNELHVNPILPDQWKSYSFKINFRGNLIEVCVSRQKTDIRCMNKELIVYCDGKAVRFKL